MHKLLTRNFSPIFSSMDLLYFIIHEEEITPCIIRIKWHSMCLDGLMIPYFDCKKVLVEFSFLKCIILNFDDSPGYVREFLRLIK